jgi:L-asparagine oxygenase
MVTLKNYFHFEKHALESIDAIIQRLSSSFVSVENREFQKACALEVSNLPSQLREYLTKIASNLCNEGYYVLSGFKIDDEKIGDSPAHWDAPWENPRYLREEIFQCLISSAIGSLFGWRTQENGRLLRHIVPIKSDENEQLGGSSKTPLFWHTEEAFHPGRADYFSLMCYRNTECVETLFVNINQLELDEKIKNILYQDRFFVNPDQSHMPHNNISNHWRMQSEQFNKMKKMLMEPLKCPVLYGTKEYPMMTVDQAFMFVPDKDHEAKIALDAFYEALDKKAIKIIMNPGDIVIIDNLATAHARASYKPYYGPRQRWMRRVNIRNGRRAYLNYSEYDNSYIME